MVRFVADATVGRLARWLRLLGYDTEYCAKIGAEILRGPCGSGRIVLTRNGSLAKREGLDRVLWVAENDPEEQLHSVARSLRLKPRRERFFSRCPLCNGVVGKVDKTVVRGKVPDYVWAHHDRFSKCSRCGKIYWPGTHTDRFIMKIDRLLEDKG